MPLVIATAELLNQADLVATAYSTGGADALTIHLYQNDFTPGTGMVIGDFTEADFVGYASTALNYTVGPYLNPVGQAEAQAPSHNWTPTNSVTPNVIYGYYLTKAGPALVGAERFNSPRQMISAFDSLTLLPSLVVQNGSVSAIVQPLDS